MTGALAQVARRIEWLTDNPTAATELIEENIDSILGAARILPILTRGPQHSFVRCISYLSEPATNIHECIYPPAKNARLGRANLPGRSVLYAADQHQTAASEVGKSKYLHSIWIRPTNQVGFYVIGNLSWWVRSNGMVTWLDSDLLTTEYSRLTNDLDPEKRKILLLTDSFISWLFTRPGERYYEISARLTQRLAKQRVGIMYRSVALESGAHNIAIPKNEFDQNFEIYHLRFEKILDDHGHGLVETEVVSAASSISENGFVSWESGDTSLSSTWPQNNPLMRRSDNE